RDEDGNVHKLVTKEAAGLALKKAGGAGAKLAPNAKKAVGDPIAQKQRKEAALRRGTADRALALLVAAAEKKGATQEVLRIVV
ncbi:hypothetical protein OSL77_25700, partial [Escherichia coli]|nr:hypothetical protein [Escherichia coli]